MTTVPEPQSSAVVQLRAAELHVGARLLWSHCNVTLSPAQFCAILGPNGAGKSSLIKTILDLIPISSGSIQVFGDDPGKHRNRIGYLPQRRSFDSSTRIRGVDIVRLGLNGEKWGTPLPAFLRGKKAREEDARIEEVIDLVAATKYATRPIGQLSGGEQQRILIAQALVRRPELLLLDEPLDSLDLTNQHSVASLIRDISTQSGIAVMMVAHDVNPIVSYLDRIVYVANQRVIEGSPEDVITADKLSEIYDTPIEVLHAQDGRPVVVGAPDNHTHHAHE